MHLKPLAVAFLHIPPIFVLVNEILKGNIMKTFSDKTHQNNCLITHSYEKYHQTILSYITYRINHKYEAEDMVQDVFVRLLDYKAMLREDTVKYFLFTIARNLVTDYIRRYYKKQEVTTYIYETTTTTVADTDENCIADDLLRLENNKLSTFSPQRRKVYVLNRFEDLCVGEIADELQLSKRTVENHLLMGRKIMRAFMRQCI